MLPPSILITRSSGKTVDLMNMSPSDFDLREAVEAIAKQCRFAGNTSRFYSVAEHSMILGEFLMMATGSYKEARLALLHDVPEAYTGDILGPIKGAIPALKELDKRVWDVVAMALNVEYGRTSMERVMYYDRIFQVEVELAILVKGKTVNEVVATSSSSGASWLARRLMRGSSSLSIEDQAQDFLSMDEWLREMIEESK